MKNVHIEKNYKNRILCILLIFSNLITITGCTTKSHEIKKDKSYAATTNKDNGEWVNSLSYIDMPDGFGKIITVTVSDESNLFIAGSNNAVPTLCFYDYGSEKLNKLEFDNSADDGKTIYGMTSDGDGGVWILAGEKPAEYILDGEIKTNKDFSGRYSIVSYNSNGEYTGKVSTEALGNRQPLGILADDNKHILCWDRTEIAVFNTDGSKLFSLDLGSRNLMSVSKLEGRVIAHVAEGDKTGIYYIDMDSNGWGEYIADSKEYYENSFVGYTDCCGDRFLINNGREILSYDINNKKYDSLISWLECGLDGTRIVAFKELENENYVAALKGDNRITVIRKEYREHARQVLKLAVRYLSADLARLITQYNASNTDYKIVAEFYETEEDFNRLNTEIISGKAPDIYDFSNIPIDNYEKSGVLLDLNPYLKEFEYKLVDSVKSALEIDGKLYSLPNSFSIYSFVASSEFVGDKTSWTLDEMTETMKKCGNDMHKFGTYATKNELLKWVCTFSLANYVDKNSGKCGFENQEFIKLLKSCNDMPNDYTEFGDIKSYEDNALLKIAPIQTVSVLSVYSQKFGRNYTFIGFPNDKGNGSLFAFDGVKLAISAQSEHKDEAWEFLRTMLNDEHQSEMSIGIPIIQSVLDKQTRDAINGNLAFYNGEKVKISQSDIDKLKTLIASTTITADMNITIQNIIEEEASSYFSGDKTAEEVAKTIQSRVSIYIAEKS